MEEFLSMDNILGEDEIENLFVDTSEEVTEDPEDKEKEKEKETTEVNVETLFTGPESVGSGDEDIEQEDTSSDKDDDISPKNHFYSSIAKALKDEGIFPDLEDEDAENINTPEDLAEAIEKQIQARFDERQQRIDKALQLEIETSEIKKYENVLNYLDSIKDSALTDESEEGENLRKQLIYQDFINRGYSKERAEREISKSFSAGTDIEDAREALEGNKNFFNESYNNLIKEAEEE